MGTRYKDSKQQIQGLENTSEKDGAQFADMITYALYNIGLIIQIFKSGKYQILFGENQQGCEIKYDSWCSKSQRLSIEIEERTDKDKPWHKSGIYIKDNAIFYVQGNEEIAFLFFKKFLIQLHESGRYEEKTEPTVKSFYLPFKDASKYGIEIKTPKYSENDYWANKGWENG